MKKVFTVVVLAMAIVSTAIAGTKAPFMYGETWWCSRGQDQCGHVSVYRYGFDFNWGTISTSDLNKPVLASNSGVVAAVYDGGGYNDGWGNTVEIKIGESSYDRLAHLQSVVVKVGEYVVQGQVIGMCGTTGNSTGPHIHYQHQTAVNGSSIPWNFEDIGTPTGPSNCSYSDDGQHRYTSLNRNIFEVEKVRHGSSIGNKVSNVAWWPGNWDSNDRYDANNCARRCYREDYFGTVYGACAIVYDALGGARKAYVVKTGFYGKWNSLNGPQSSLGMPINNEYAGYGNARQDFQKGYLYWNGSSVSVNQYPNCAPGWTNSGWDNQHSYLIARAYERNGARQMVGEAMGKVVSNWPAFGRATDYCVQEFNWGARGRGMIFYDPRNYTNPEATNEAYYLYGNFLDTYTNIQEAGAWVIGAPTRDREGNVQYFKTGRMEERGGTVYAYNAAGTQVWPIQVHISTGIVDPKSDLAVLYDYGGCQTRAHVLLSNGSNFAYQGNDGWKILNNYCLQYVFKSIAGDYNGDGLTDIAMIYKYGESSVGIHMLLSRGSSFEYQVYWWQSNGYCTYAIKGAVSGDFNGDCKDDIAVVYNYGSCDTRIHVLLSTGTNFIYQGNEGWWHAPGWYCAEAVKFVSAGDLNGDGGDDIVMAYKYGPASTALHVFLTNGTYFNYVPYWFWADGWFSLDAMKFMEMGDLNSDGKSDLVMACRYGPSETALLAFLSTGSGFNYRGWWWHFDSYSLDAMPYMQMGDINGDGYADVVMACRYGQYSSAIHSFLSTGSSFLYQAYWWRAEGYGWDYTNGFIMGKFNASGSGLMKQNTETEEDVSLPKEFALSQNYPNPFNPTTTISYTLPQAGEVSLEVYNLLGQKVETILNEYQEAGEYAKTWEASRYASGVYFYRLSAGSFTQTKKMLLVK
ncbi:MAG: peptidoglycan DD-metalloendopeptidase family protein [Patescibacteria group bacterium]|jgi:hypothetical protein